MAIIVLPFVIAVTTLIGIVADYRRARTAVYVFKPLSTVLIIALAALAQPAECTYQVLIIIGLVFSLGGDVSLMLPEEPRSYFIPGLVSFLIAHLFYVGAFSMCASWAGVDALILVPFVLFGIGTAAYLWPHLGPMKVPVACYIVVILAMGWRAGVRSHADIPMTGAVCALVGAILFIASDLFLAINRFARPFPAARAIVLGTYFSAQTLIALSVHL